MSSRGGQNPRPYTATPPGSRHSQNRASRDGQHKRPSTATTPGSTRTQDGRQAHNSKEDMEKVKKGFKEHAEKRANLLHQSPNNVDLRDVEEHLPKGDTKTNKSELEKYKRTNETLTQENNQLLSINKSLTEEIKCLTELKQSLQKKELENNAELKRYKGKIENLEEENSQLSSKNTSLTEEIKHLNELKQSFLNRDRELCTKEVEQVRNKMKDKHEKEKAKLLKRNDSLTKEKEDLLKRLSIITSDRLTHENPNIADLSDEDRPTKLQEVYGELYNNEWTDAFEELTRDKNVLEKDAIGILLKIIMNSFHNCREVTWGRYEKLVNVASSIHLEKESPLPCTEKNRSEEEVKSVNAYNDGKPNENTEDKNALNREENGIETLLTKPDTSTTSAEKNGDENHKASADPKNCEDNEIEPPLTKPDTSTTSAEKNGDEKHIASADPKSIAEDKMKDDNKNINTGSNWKEDAAKKDKGNKETPENPNAKCSIELNVDILHALKGIWKKANSELKGISVESICSVVVTNLDMPLESMPNTSKYLESCVDLCWKMGVQEKPLHLEAIDEIDVNAGKKFDKDKFKHYTKSGQKVDYVVWPALYLYEGGPLLHTGVAQGC